MAELQNVQGLAELHKALKQLPDNIARNVLRGAARAGGRAIQQEAKRRAPVDTGRLRRAIYLKQIREKSGMYQQTLYVGVLMGKAHRTDKRTRRVNGQKVTETVDQDAWYGVLIEYGTSKMAARPFMRPAWETKKGDALVALTDYMKQRLPAEIAKL